MAAVPYEVLDVAIAGVETTELCRSVMRHLSNAKRIIVVAGAGISVAAGIPDFRSSTGLFATLKADTKYKPSGKALFDASVYKSEEGTQSYNEMITSLHKMTKTATPTKFHIFVDSISPRIQRIYTQNIDSLENRFATLATKVPLPPKAPWPKTIQLHGDVHFAVCSKCHWVGPLDPAQLSSPEEMGCQECQVADDVRQVVGKRVLGVGIIRPRVVLYNETNPDADAIGAVSNADIRSRPPPDLLLVVGTSLKIPGTKRITRETINAVHHSPRGKAIWINIDPPPSKDFDIWIKGDCQRIPHLYDSYERFTEQQKVLETEEVKRKEEEKARVTEERMEKQTREKFAKEERARERERRREEKQLALREKERRIQDKKTAKEQKDAEKARRELERAIRPTKKVGGVKVEEHRWSTRQLTPPLSYNTDSTLSSPSMSDIEFASFVESTRVKSAHSTPSIQRTMGYLPTPAPTPQKKQAQGYEDKDSPLKNKKRKWPEDHRKEHVTPHRDTMSIRFITDSD